MGGPWRKDRFVSVWVCVGVWVCGCVCVGWGGECLCRCVSTRLDMVVCACVVVCEYPVQHIDHSLLMHC